MCRLIPPPPPPTCVCHRPHTLSGVRERECVCVRACARVLTLVRITRDRVKAEDSGRAAEVAATLLSTPCFALPLCALLAVQRASPLHSAPPHTDTITGCCCCCWGWSWSWSCCSLSVCAGEVVGTGSTREQLVLSSLTTHGICSRRERSGSACVCFFFLSSSRGGRYRSFFFFFCFIFYFLIIFSMRWTYQNLKWGLRSALFSFFSPPRVFNEHPTEKTLWTSSSLDFLVYYYYYHIFLFS